MTKGKAKSSSSVSVAPAQPRSLRSKTRECPSDETLETQDVQADLHHQDTEGHNTAVDAMLLQCHQSPLQESITSTRQQEAAEQACLTKQDHDTEGKHAEVTHFDLRKVSVKASEEQEETTVTDPNNDSQPEGVRAHADDAADMSGKDKKEVVAEECSRVPSQTCTDQLLVFLPVSEEGDGTALEVDAKENSQCNSERNQEASEEEPSNVCMAEVKEIPKEAAAGLPPKKKRRMGMCGLTERERSHFLLTRKRENGQNGPERVEKQICDSKADLVAQEEVISSSPSSSSLSIPVGSVTEQSEAEHQSSQCGGDDRSETEVHITVTTSDVTGAVLPGPEQTGDTKSDTPAEEEKILVHQEQKELEGGTAEIVAEEPQEQMKDGEDGSAAVDQSAAVTFYFDQNEEAQKREATEAALLQVNGVIETREEAEEESTVDGAEAGASPTDSRSGGGDAVELCEAAVTPGGSERKLNGTCDDEPALSTVDAEPPQTRDTSDPFGSGYLDYVSDSQLNTIVLIEEEVVMEREEDPGPADCPEDASDLICGLIRELSSLNRKVMAAHRELENLRRSSKSSRSSKR